MATPHTLSAQGQSPDSQAAAQGIRETVVASGGPPQGPGQVEGTDAESVVESTAQQLADAVLKAGPTPRVEAALQQLLLFLNELVNPTQEGPEGPAPAGPQAPPPGAAQPLGAAPPPAAVAGGPPPPAGPPLA